MGLVVVQPPAVEPVSAAEVTRFLRLASESEAGVAAALIPAARILVETHTGCALIRRTLRETRPATDRDERGRLSLSFGPVISISSATAAVGGGAAAPILASRDASDPYYMVRVKAPADATSVTIDCLVGFGVSAGDVPADLRQAVLELCASLMVGRDDAARPAISPRAGALMAPYQRAGGGGSKPPRFR
jgi:uncharacterized phiE125 gp8 family phage protein